MAIKKKKKKSKRSGFKKRIERLSRTAALLRLRGDVNRATSYERMADDLIEKVGDNAGFATQGRGVRRGEKLHTKLRFAKAKARKD